MPLTQRHETVLVYRSVPYHVNPVSLWLTFHSNNVHKVAHFQSAIFAGACYAQQSHFSKSLPHFHRKLICSINLFGFWEQGSLCKRFDRGSKLVKGVSTRLPSGSVGTQRKLLILLVVHRSSRRPACYRIHQMHPPFSQN